jgi:cysteinyl-tRNA synthetase
MQNTHTIKIWDSLTGKAVPLTTIDANHIKAYICGPTVYDSAHLGHARTYVTFDIIRRILMNYFRYNVTWVMNITDIDDKIIQRASVVVDDSKNKTTTLANTTALARKYEAEFLKDMHDLNVLPADITTRVSEYIPEIISMISTILKHELAYVAKSGSVYFNVDAFEAKGFQYGKLCPKHAHDHKVGVNTNVNDGAAGVASDDVDEKKEKLHIRDFALWKAVKHGPTWSSPWSNGRPGWHIECSAMSASVLGPVIDLHMGGQDLKFPHHDNELAQSDAANFGGISTLSTSANFGSDVSTSRSSNSSNSSVSKQELISVRHFIHSGHLNISGMKMSKSLKNFVTIREMLQHNTANDIRMLFLLHSWHGPMNYSHTTDSMNEAKAKNRLFSEFIMTANAILRNTNNVADNIKKWFVTGNTNGNANANGQDQDQKINASFALHTTLLDMQTKIHTALLNNFDYAVAVAHLASLVDAANKYIATSADFNVNMIQRIYNYVTMILSTFGLQYLNNSETNDTVAALMGLLSKFRSDVRRVAKQQQPRNMELFKLADGVREQLPKLGIRLEDQQDGTSIWKKL